MCILINRFTFIKLEHYLFLGVHFKVQIYFSCYSVNHLTPEKKKKIDVNNWTSNCFLPTFSLLAAIQNKSVDECVCEP